jgi:alkyl hydroperoxide reductase subunit AhpC
MKIPILADFSKKVATDYGVLLPDGIPLRALFIIDPKGTLRCVALLMVPLIHSFIHAQTHT